jgi:hypothetical protein
VGSIEITLLVVAKAIHERAGQTTTSVKLKTITLLAAIAQLLAVLCSLASCPRSLMELVGGQMEWKHSWLYLSTMPVYLFAGIMFTIFLFTLAVKQKNN